MAECHHCKTAIRGESGILCEGVCKKVFHCSKKCSGIDQYSRGILESGGFIRFLCDDCLQYIHNVDLVLSDVQENVKRNKENLAEYKDEFKESLRQNEREIKQLLEAIEKRYSERLKKLNDAQKACDLNVKEIKKIYDVMNKEESKSKEVCSLIRESNVLECEELKKIIKETSVEQNKVSYSDVVKNAKVVPDLNKQIPLIVKPKEKQGSKKTKEDLNKKVDPGNLKICNIESRKNGTLVIQSENNEEREKIKSAIQSEMGENYEIRVPKPSELYVDIKFMSFKYTEKEITEKLMRQNSCLNDSKFKFVKTFEIKRNDKIIKIN